jgi:predicted alpha/beta-hydrolase family hydrolase
MSVSKREQRSMTPEQRLKKIAEVYETRKLNLVRWNLPSKRRRCRRHRKLPHAISSLISWFAAPTKR